MYNTIVRYRSMGKTDAWHVLVPSPSTLEVIKRSEAESSDVLMYYPLRDGAKRRQTLVIFANRAPAIYPNSVSSLIAGLKKMVFALNPKMDEIRERLFAETAVHEIYRRPPAVVAFLHTWLFPLTAGTSQDTVWIAGQSLTDWVVEEDKLTLIFGRRHEGAEVQLTWGHLTTRQLNLLIQYDRKVSAEWQRYYLRLYGRVLSTTGHVGEVRPLHVNERQLWLKNLVFGYRTEFDALLYAHSNDFIMEGFWEEWWAIIRRII